MLHSRRITGQLAFELLLACPQYIRVRLGESIVLPRIRMTGEPDVQLIVKCCTISIHEPNDIDP